MRSLYEHGLTIRAFEETMLDLFKQGQISGTTHTCIGQELCAVCLYTHLTAEDAVFSNHRCHGHFLASGGDPESLASEILGREGGVCSGRGGSQHLCHDNFFSNGIQGGMAPVAVGYGEALRRAGTDRIAVCHLGDGTMGQGVVYEAFNFAAILKTPVLFFMEDNGIAQTTDTGQTTGGDPVARAKGFGLDASECDACNVEAMHDHLQSVVSDVRRGKPHFVRVKTNRLGPHSKGDDTRSEELVAGLRACDPLTNALDDPNMAEYFKRETARMAAMAQSVLDKPSAVDPATPVLALPEVAGRTSRDLRQTGDAPPRMNMALNTGLQRILDESELGVVLGQDILAPYGGAFKVTRDISETHPDRVISTPISEAGTVGLANGMALAGMLPVVEIMFGDFATLAVDQIVNQAAKYHAMYAGKRTCPVTVRLVSGGGRGYGPTHSQCLEPLFCGIPGIRVLALSRRHDGATMLHEAVTREPNPTIFTEYKEIYPLGPLSGAPAAMEPSDTNGQNGDFPPLRFVPADGLEADATIVTYGGMTDAVESTMDDLLRTDERLFDYFILSQLWPLTLDEIIESARKTKRLCVVEEAHQGHGVGSAIIAGVASHVPGMRVEWIGSDNRPIPNALHLEQAMRPGKAAIKNTIRNVFKGRQS